MNILYVAKHDSGGNDDEGAITHALESLGHHVTRLDEHKAAVAYKHTNIDFLLFHKWYNPTALNLIKFPKVFWYFDLVDYPDSSMDKRCKARTSWMDTITPIVDLGFCTDGDWVKQDQSGKLITLRQGADIRKVGLGVSSIDRIPILFTGIKHGGEQRSSFVATMRGHYGNRFCHHQSGIHGRELANLIASARVVVAPDGPITNHYWSNRVYLTLGFGGFLMHPYCSELAKEYGHGSHIIYYHNRSELHELISKYLYLPEERKSIRENALEHTIANHTYTNRCEQLIKIVEERLL